jgi:hypothetical protein
MVNLDHRDQYEERVCVICVQALGLDPQISHLLRLASRHREHRQLARTPGRCFRPPAIGEPKRAFCSARFTHDALCSSQRRAAVGARVGGAIDPDDTARGLIASVFGGTSESERNRIEVGCTPRGRPTRRRRYRGYEQPVLDACDCASGARCTDACSDAVGTSAG